MASLKCLYELIGEKKMLKFWNFFGGKGSYSKDNKEHFCLPWLGHMSWKWKTMTNTQTLQGTLVRMK